MPFTLIFSVFITDIFTMWFLHFECAESSRRVESVRKQVLFFGFCLGFSACGNGSDSSESSCHLHFVVIHFYDLIIALLVRRIESLRRISVEMSAVFRFFVWAILLVMMMMMMMTDYFRVSMPFALILLLLIFDLFIMHDFCLSAPLRIAASVSVEIAFCFPISVCALLLVAMAKAHCRSGQHGICKRLFIFHFQNFIT